MKAILILGAVLLALGALLRLVRLGALAEYSAAGLRLKLKVGPLRLMPVAPPPGTAVDRVVEMVPDVIDKVTGFIEKQQDKDKSQG